MILVLVYKQELVSNNNVFQLHISSVIMNIGNLEELLKGLDSESLKKLQELALEQKKQEENEIREKIKVLEEELAQLKSLLPQEVKTNGNTGVTRPRTGVTKWCLIKLINEPTLTNQQIVDEVSTLFPESEFKATSVAWCRSKIKKMTQAEIDKLLA